MVIMSVILPIDIIIIQVVEGRSAPRGLGPHRES